MKRLHLGCGNIAPEGWVNVDGSPNVVWAKWPRLRSALIALRALPKTANVVYPPGIVRMDLTRPLPYPDGSFDAVYSSHTLEHLYLSQTCRLLRECLRVLRPGGIARMLVPDLRAICEEYMGLTRMEWRGAGPEPACGADRMNLRLLMREPDPRSGGLASRMSRALLDLHSHKWMFDADSLAYHMTEAGFEGCGRRAYAESDIPGVESVELRSRIEGGQGTCVEGRKPG